MFENMKSLSIDAKFSHGTNPYENIKFEKRIAEIKTSNGDIVFRQKGVEVPIEWSQLATNIVASKYFYGELGTPEREFSVKQLIDRVAKFIADKGEKQGYLDSENANKLFNELRYILINQMGCFNSPVMFNAGLFLSYGINIQDTFPNYYNDIKKDEVKQCQSQYEYPQLSACFINRIEDNLGSIFKANDTEGRLFKHGSGVGTNNSRIRSSKEIINGGGIPSGPLSFMKIRDQVAQVVKSGGKTRRASKLEALNHDHPDIIEFIRAKPNEEKKAHILIDGGIDGSFNGEAYQSVMFQNSNFSISVTDEFMKKAVANETYWTKAITTGKDIDELNAKDVLKEIAQGTHFCGDPALLFIDTINGQNTCAGSDVINCTNPCGEFVFIDESACNLFSLNILKFKNEDGTINIDDYLHAINVAIIAQEIIIDAASYPTKEICKNATIYRPLGLGLTNIGALIMSLGIPYASDSAYELIGSLTSVLSAQAYKMSIELAELKGTFSSYKKNKKHMLGVIQNHLDLTIANNAYISNPEADKIFKIAQELWEDVIVSGKQYGFRNAQVTLLAPTGTISFMMDATTTGIEPELSLIKYKLLAGDKGGTIKIVNQIVPEALKTLEYSDNEIKKILSYIDRKDTIEGCATLMDEHLSVFDCALKPVNGKRSIFYLGHLEMMAACIPYLSGSISKTVNLSEDTTVNDIVDIYIEAWKLGLKGIAIYRDGSKRTQPLNTSKTKKDYKIYAPIRIKPNKIRQAITHDFEITGHKFYVTVGLYDDGRPCELFIKANKTGSTINGLLDVVGIVISKALQHGVDLNEFVDKLAFTKFEPSGITDNEDIRVAHSVIDYIARWLGLQFLNKTYKPEPLLPLNGITKDKAGEDNEDTNNHLLANENADIQVCIHCGGNAYRQGACYVCYVCGTTTGCS